MALPAIKLDTLKLAQELEESGATKQQAQTQTHVFVKLVNTMIEENVATKKDFHHLESRLDSIDNRLTLLENKVDGNYQALDRKIDMVYQTLDQKIDSECAKLHQKIDYFYYTLNQKIDTVYQTLDKKIDAVYEKVILTLTVRLGGIMIAGIGALAILIKLK